MRTLPLIISIIAVSLIVALYYFLPMAYSLEGDTLEGYETLTEKITNRSNPLAAQQNPLTNPAVSIGISEAAGRQLTNTNQMALNIQKLVPNNTGTFTQIAPPDQISPRVDNENSYLGMIKMCKEKGVGDSPFSDPAFAESCGMCLTSGTLKSGEIFKTPTGVLVYKADKDNFIKEKQKNGYLFPRAIPSVMGGTCDGATRSDNAEPVLAITQKDYTAFKNRIACRATHTFGNSCGQCVSNKEFSWIDPNGGTESITLWLWGSGTVIVTLGGKVMLGQDKTKPVLLSMDKTKKVPFGKVAEGTTLTITVSQLETEGEITEDAYVYGFITSLTPANKMYKLPIDKFLEVDSTAGASIRKGPSKYFSDVAGYSVKIMPQANKKTLSPNGFIPLTFVTPDELAVYDCPTSPLVSMQGSAELLINDACLNPRGQGPGTYTQDCLRQSLLYAGCSTNGSWYKNPTIDSRTDIGSWMASIAALINVPQASMDPKTSMGCRGIDISTPCDNFIKGGTPDKACMAYLYSNNSEGSSSGRSYNTSTGYISKTGKTYQFCQPAGSLNPANPNGLAALQGASAGYSGLTGIDAVRRYLSDIFTKATSDLDINVADAYGGRKDSWTQCIGMPVADVPVNPINTNASGSMLNNSLPAQPSAPSKPRLQIGTNQQKYDDNYKINVDWYAEDNGSPITSYIISLSGVGQWTVPFTGVAYGPKEGINVNPSTNYTFTVIAVNAVGQSPPRSMSVTTPGRAPPPPPPPPPAGPQRFPVAAAVWLDCGKQFGPYSFGSGATRQSFKVGWSFPESISYLQLNADTAARLINNTGNTIELAKGQSFNYCTDDINGLFKNKTIEILLFSD